MKDLRTYFLFLFLVLITACTVVKNTGETVKLKDIEFTVLQLNDVYEIAPLQGGKVGGMARVATFRKQLIKENPNVITILSGDFVSPSLIGTLKDPQGNSIKGAQMIDAMNAIGMDYVVFGNHEFDLKYKDLQKRLNESKFEWLSCNAFHVNNKGHVPFHRMIDGVAKPSPKYVIREIKTANGTMKLGILGVVLPFNKKAYVHYEDIYKSVETTYNEMKDKCDMVIALTHLEMYQDKELARRVTGIPLFLGGHDHVNMSAYVEKTIITKADANAKTVYVHRIKFNQSSKKPQIQSSLVPINDKIAEDKVVAGVVNKWIKIGDESMAKMGYKPNQKLANFDEPLDGRESSIRYHPTNLGTLIAKSLLALDKDADLAFYNSGSVRVDDQLISPILEFDILRTLPFGGGLVKAEIKGGELAKILEIGTVTNNGIGGYLQMTGVEKKDGKWLVNGMPLNGKKTYVAIAPDFLMQGKEANFEFLKDVPRTRPEKWGTVKNDIRDAVIDYLLKQK